jgi:energy-coupling factor transporter ATP-binding protein EcfA2
MKFISFNIKNFKGIEDITFNLDKSPEANIYTLVGLNESGKTTILEAINFFSPRDKGLSSLDLPGGVIKDYNNLIPISKRDNFNETIEINVEIKLEPEDIIKIEKFVKLDTPLKDVTCDENILNYYRRYHFKDSQFERLESLWTGFKGIKKTSKKPPQHIGIKFHPDINLKLASFCEPLIPSILYFPNFLFDFPAKILLETKEKPTSKESFYLELIQDILNSLENDTNVKTHIVDRIKSKDQSQKRNLGRLIQKMETQVTNMVFEAWNRIFKRKITNTRLVINYEVDEDDLAFLEFEIEAEDGIYQINERSLGFKWFFIFLLFTQFRPFRKDSPQNVIFLFDEPASNLHSSAQKQLLKSFENLIDNAKIIYTTHSHHLINPNWLESTYVVKNEGLELDKPESYNVKKTNISIQSYREFVTHHPHNTAYFQPILDVLDYVPSNLENLPNCIFLEGKNDYYSLSYFKDVIFPDKYNLNMAPSTGSGNLDTLISLYIGWGREFIILLDSDKAGKVEKQRYIDKFGLIVEKRIYLLSDINVLWDKKELESLFDSSDKIELQKTAYPTTAGFNKTHFNRAIQESLVNKIYFEFSAETLGNMTKILDFLDDKFQI